jgi:hypothetical protein
MNSKSPSSHYPSVERAQTHGYASSGPEQPRKTGDSTKKCASRAGIRSISTLSAAQLERKRENDREKKRKARQRTKDYIDGLNNTISELCHSCGANETVALITRKWNWELEEENLSLRLRLSEAGLANNVLPPRMFAKAWSGLG